MQGTKNLTKGPINRQLFNTILAYFGLQTGNTLDEVISRWRTA